MGDDECSECMEAMPMAHWHDEHHKYEEIEPEPFVVHKPAVTWEDLLDTFSTKEPVKPAEPVIPLKKESRRHSDARLDGGDFICDACGAVSADFDLFEEVGAEVACKSVEAVRESEEADKAALAESYKKLMRKVGPAPREFKLPEWPTMPTYTHVSWTSKTGFTTGVYPAKVSKAEVEEIKTHKTYQELAAEFRAANEDPENQKKWYSEVQREMQRRERRR